MQARQHLHKSFTDILPRTKPPRKGRVAGLERLQQLALLGHRSSQCGAHRRLAAGTHGGSREEALGAKKIPTPVGKTGSKRRPGREGMKADALELLKPGVRSPAPPSFWGTSQRSHICLSMTLTWGRHRETARGVTCGAKAQGEQQNHGAMRQRSAFAAVSGPGCPDKRRDPAASTSTHCPAVPEGCQRSEASEGELFPPLPWLAGGRCWRPLALPGLQGHRPARLPIPVFSLCLRLCPDLSVL